MIYGLRDVGPECQEPNWKIRAELEPPGEGLSHAAWVDEEVQEESKGRQGNQVAVPGPGSQGR